MPNLPLLLILLVILLLSTELFLFFIFLFFYISLFSTKKLKRAFVPFITRDRVGPLAYEITWKGIVNENGLGDDGIDYGNGV
jgi:hypothetical protein